MNVYSKNTGKTPGVFYAIAILVVSICSCLILLILFQQIYVQCLLCILTILGDGDTTKKTKSTVSWSLYSSTVRRQAITKTNNKRCNIETVINATKKKEGKTGGGGDVETQLEVAFESKDQKDRETNHAGVWGKTTEGRGDSKCKDTESGTKKKKS